MKSDPNTTSKPAVMIHMQGLSKQYTLHRQRPFLLKHSISRLLRRQQDKNKKFRAVHDITASIKSGESVGIIGSNGAGKSTLLSLIAGSVYPSEGMLEVNGRIGALLELGAGFHMDLTGRENVYLNASLLGLNRDDIESQFHQILDFSELHDFIDVQIKNYSSGMLVRLAFSVAIHIDPQIVLIDEALSVGDRHFQEKCVERILSFKEQKKTLIFVSHSMDLVKLLCNRVLWLKSGRLHMDGHPDVVIPKYNEYADTLEDNDSY